MTLADTHGTVLAFDLGLKRTGVASGELSLGIAHPLTVIQADSTAFIDEYAQNLILAFFNKIDIHQMQAQAFDQWPTQLSCFFSVLTAFGHFYPFQNERAGNTHSSTVQLNQRP